MKFLCILVIIVVLLICQIYCEAEKCSEEICRAPTCQCSSTKTPGGLKLEDTPQFVTLSFDDAVVITNIDLYRNFFKKRKNHDNCPVAATFFVTHEYTDYTLVHELFASGHEIATHSVSHTPYTDKWAKMSVEDLKDEFVGMREILEKFAKIPKGHIKGIRMPFLQPAGNNLPQMMMENGFLYDYSMITRKYLGLWPYTLEYKSKQDCQIPKCPTESYPGVWECPILPWKGKNHEPCAMVDTCLQLPAKREELFHYFLKNFNRTYLTNKAPTGFHVHASWFIDEEERIAAYKQFVDYLQSLPDVYIVGASDIIHWIQNPVPVSEMATGSWKNCRKQIKPDCTTVSCQLCKKDGNQYADRWTKICDGPCPSSYPWLGNYYGENDYNRKCIRY